MGEALGILAKQVETPDERKLGRAVDTSIAQENARYLKALEEAGPGACPNCLETDGGHCWCCSDRENPPRGFGVREDEG